MNELVVTKKIEFFLNTLGYITKTEIPNLGTSVDIVGHKNNRIACVEVKLRDWKKGLKQCDNHKIVADYIFLGIATKTISEVLIKKANEKGMGIIHYDKYLDSCNMVLKAKMNKCFWKPQQQIFKQKFDQF